MGIYVCWNFYLVFIKKSAFWRIRKFSWLTTHISVFFIIIIIIKCFVYVNLPSYTFFRLDNFFLFKNNCIRLSVHHIPFTNLPAVRFFSDRPCSKGWWELWCLQDRAVWIWMKTNLKTPTPICPFHGKDPCIDPISGQFHILYCRG